ncbi:MAG: hypothetical protein AUI47_09785 [Acidobacteria bacterium 13_1_40CM_2_68_5]|nr:MAG: hypothetical protein AUI47_09785 [Acidobacteria bacterium 13_1_40CM_2_68_5]
MTSREDGAAAAGGGRFPAARGRAAALAVAVVCALVNLPSVRPGFIHDDHRIIEQNERIRGLELLPQVVSTGYWMPGDVAGPSLYRPITLLTFTLNHSMGGLRPFGYRVVDLLLHVLNSMLVFRLAGLRQSLDTPLLAGLLFAVHPAHTEVLGEVVGRAELLAAGGALGSVLAFLTGREAGRPRTGMVRGAAPWAWYALSLVLFVIGCLAKENAAVTPALVLAADLLLSDRRPVYLFHLAGFATLGGILVLRHAVLSSAGAAAPIPFLDNPIVQWPFLQGRLTALKVIAKYALLMIWPARMSIDYSFAAIPPVTGPLDPGALAGGALVLAWAATSVGCGHRSPGGAFAVAWIGLALAPVANLLFPIGTLMAERLLYLPSVGFCLVSAAAITWGTDRLSGQGRWAGRAARLAVALVLVALAARTVVRLRDWRDDYTIFRAALRVTPDSVRALFNFAAASEWGTDRLSGQGRWAGRAARLAVALVLVALAARTVVRLRDWRDDYTIFRAALRVTPDSVRALFNFAAASEERGDDATATNAYTKALGLWGDFADGHYNLAGVVARQKQGDEAVAHYREAVRLQPGNVQYLVNLAHALIGLGRDQEARDLLRRAVAIDPRSAVGYTNLGSVELKRGNIQEALRAYAEAVRLEPGNADYQRNLAVAEHEAEDPRAVETFRRALTIRPGDPDLLDGLGLSLLDAGDAGAAREALGRAVAGRPEHPVYRYHLARALEQSNNLPEAAAQYRDAIRLAPGVPIPYRGLGFLLERMGDHGGALAALERAADLDPGGTVMDDRARALLVSLRRRGHQGPRTGS